MRTAVQIGPPFLSARMVDRPDSRAPEALPEEAEGWLTAEQCAELLNVSRRWCGRLDFSTSVAARGGFE